MQTPYLEAKFIPPESLKSESTFMEFETKQIFVPAVANPTVISITYSLGLTSIHFKALRL